jgi:hypothetical protein
MDCSCSLVLGDNASFSPPEAWWITSKAPVWNPGVLLLADKRQPAVFLYLSGKNYILQTFSTII